MRASQSTDWCHNGSRMLELWVLRQDGGIVTSPTAMMAPIEPYFGRTLALKQVEANGAPEAKAYALIGDWNIGKSNN